MRSRRMGQAQRRIPCRSVQFTLAALPGGGRARQCGCETRCPRLVGVRRDGPGPFLGEPRAQRRIVVQTPDRAASAALSAAGTTSPVASWRTRPPAAAPTASVAMTAQCWFMASLATSPHGSTKRVEGMDGMATTLRARVEVAQVSGAQPACTIRRGRVCFVAVAGEDERRLGGAARRRHAAASSGTPFSRSRAADEEHRERRGAPPARRRRRPERVVDRLWRRPRAVRRGGGERRDVGAVGDDGGGAWRARAREEQPRGARPKRAPPRTKGPSPAGAEPRRPGAPRVRRCPPRRRGAARRGEGMRVALVTWCGTPGSSTPPVGVVSGPEQREFDARPARAAHRDAPARDPGRREFSRRRGPGGGSSRARPRRRAGSRPRSASR